jgi:hypothetical protein
VCDCRAIHTNLNARFKCDSLKMAMIKTQRLAKKLFGEQGGLYDCVCKVRLQALQLCLFVCVLIRLGTRKRSRLRVEARS